MGITYDGGLTCSCGVTDMDRSIAWCELKTGVERVNIGLGVREEAGGKGGATLTFGVTDIEAAKAELDRHEVRQDGPIRDIPGMVRLLTFFDPDDNALMFYQDLMEAHVQGA